MKTSGDLVRLGRACSAFAGAVLLISSIGFSGASAAPAATITVSAPRVKIVEHGPGTATAAQQVTLTARVQYDPVTLTTNSGVALLKDGVLQAAHKVCQAADPSAVHDNACIRKAIAGAQPQVDAAIAQARAHEQG
jgi:UrcA family protein